MRKIIYAKLHATTFLPGVGQLSDSLPPKDKSLGLIMTESSDGIILDGVDAAKRPFSAVIPWPNVQIAQFALEAAAPSLKVAKG